MTYPYQPQPPQKPRSVAGTTLKVILVLVAVVVGILLLIGGCTIGLAQLS